MCIEYLAIVLKRYLIESLLVAQLCVKQNIYCAMKHKYSNK